MTFGGLEDAEQLCLELWNHNALGDEQLQQVSSEMASYSRRSREKLGLVRSAFSSIWGPMAVFWGSKIEGMYDTTLCFAGLMDHHPWKLKFVSRGAIGGERNYPSISAHLCMHTDCKDFLLKAG